MWVFWASGRWRGGVLSLALLAGLTGCSEPRAPAGPVPFYRFDDHLEDAAKQGADPGSEHEGAALSFDEGAAAWTAGAPSTSCAIADGKLVFATQGAGWVTSPDGLGIDGSATDALWLRMQVTGTRQLALEWRTRGGEWSEQHRVVTIHVAKPGEMVVYRLQVSGVNAWRHRTIDQLRLRTDVSASVEVDGLRVVTRRDAFSHAAVGLREFSVNHRVRPCLFAHCPATLTYRVAVPDRGHLTMGLAVLEPAAPVAFEVQVERGGATETVFAETVAGNADWRDVRVDLAAYAGEEVAVVFRAACDDAGQVALWSNPILFQAKRAGSRGGPAPQPLRNVLVYVVDCLRADHLDAYGYSRETGPHFRAFGRKGVRFARCFAQDTWTKPSMSSLATGVDSFVHGIERYGDVIPGGLVMLPEILRAAGYATCAISENPHTPPDADQRRAYCFQEATHLRVELDDPPLRWNQLPDVTYAAASRFLDTHRDRNFFLYVHTMEPHDIPVEHPGDQLVYDPPEPFRSRWADSADPAPMDLYDGGISFADANFQRVVDKLEELGLRDDTLVIVTADHGEAFGEHEGKFGHAGKPYNELTYVPLFMGLPRVLPARRVVEENVQLIDLPPTILELLGLPANEQFLGANLWPLIARREAGALKDRAVASNWVGFTAAVKQDAKLFHDTHADIKMLFDLRTDFGETHDLAASRPDTAGALQAELAAYIRDRSRLGTQLQAQEDEAVL